MKKVAKFILGGLITFIILFTILWVGITYVTEYKKTTRDTNHSPNGKYELILQAVGEAEWPFGSASGCLLLKDGEKKISQTNFELKNDGGSINSHCWSVTWCDEYVEVIISGKEQFDEEIILYFDGKKERRQITGK